MTLLPRRLREPIERLGDPMMEIVVRSFNPVPRTSAVRPGERRWDREPQKYRKIGCEASGRKSICGGYLGVRQTATSYLVGVGGKEKSVGQDDLSEIQGWADLGFDELSPGCHEQERFRSRPDVATWLEQQTPDLVSDCSATRFPHAEARNATRGKRVAQAAKLRGFSNALRPFENDQLTAPRRHPSVMIELVAPFLMPSVIQLFTCSIVLSKFSCAVIAR